jgi:anti-sigma factor RsiW
MLGGYVLHALEPEEAQMVRHHLAACTACAAEHGQLMSVPAMLDAVDPDEEPAATPPPALEEAVLDRFAREHRGFDVTPDEPRKPSLGERLRRPFRHLSRPLPAALAGAAAAAAITAALLVLPGSGGGQDGRVYQASLSGSAAAPAATAKADLRVLDSGTRVKLSVRGLQGNPSSVYELWCLRDDGAKVSAGTFRTDGQGRADVSLTTAAIPGEYHRLSIERKSFTPATAVGERVMAGEIEYPHS